MHSTSWWPLCVVQYICISTALVWAIHVRSAATVVQNCHPPSLSLLPSDHFQTFFFLGLIERSWGKTGAMRSYLSVER